MTGRTPSPNALGDPRALYARFKCGDCGTPVLQCQSNCRTARDLVKEAERQLELRDMIPPGGRRALYLDHLHALAEETGAILTLYHPRGFVAGWRGEHVRFPGEPSRITTPLPLTVSHYLTGLHEFGHVHQTELGGTSNHGITPEGIYGELMAYLWAFEHSKVSIPFVDIRHAQMRPLFEAKEIGWSGGPVADFLPVHLRQPFLDAMARLGAIVDNRLTSEAVDPVETTI